MTQEEYLLWVAPRIVLDSLERNLLPSPRISQACFEPAYGTSLLAVKAKALFGVKDNDQWAGQTYNKDSGEFENGQYLGRTSNFRAYETWEESITDQGDYLENRWVSSKNPNIKRYANLKGVRNYKEFARLLKADGYATSPEYEQRVIKYVEMHELTRYDSMTREEALAMIGEEKKEMIGVNAGHTLRGVGSGAVGFINESEHTRKVALALEQYLKTSGVAVKECTIDTAQTQNAYLARVVEMANGVELKWFISIHFNAGGGRGVEVYTYQGRQYEDALDVYRNIAALGFKNRGVKEGTGLYVVRKTKAKSMLVEVCFVDTEDAKQYLATGADKIGQAIAAALVPIAAPELPAPIPPVKPEKQKYVRVKVNELNVRKAPSWENKAIAGTVRIREVFTVVDTMIVGKTPMHKLKSGLYITGSEKYVETYEK